MRGTGFLTYDYADVSVDDDQWLYLPALRKVRRISASDRGDFFLGTDFTYEDIKKEQKVEINDYAFQAKGSENVEGIFEFFINIRDKELAPMVEKRQKEINDLIQRTLERVTWRELQTPVGKERAKKVLRHRINDYFEGNIVIGIYYRTILLNK